MMKIFYLNSQMNTRLLQSFADFYNSLTDEHIEIHLDSFGGDVSAAESFVRLININPDRFTIVVTGAAYSSAFLMLINAKCERIITDNAIGMLHQIRSNTDVNMHGVECSRHIREYYNKLKPHYTMLDTKLINKLKLTAEQQSAYYAGDNVLFNFIELRRIIKLCK